MRIEINLGTIIVGIVGYLFGGWNMMLQTLVFLMVADYITGIAAACFNKSSKSNSGGLSSKAGFKGLIKKMMVLFICSVAYRIDCLTGAQGLLFNVVVLFYISNEAISILENVAATDKIPIPAKLRNVLESLKEGAEDGDKDV